MLPKQLNYFTFPPTVYVDPSFSTSLPSVVIVCLLRYSHPKDEVESYYSFDRVFLYSTNDVEPLFTYLLAICKSSLEKYLFKSIYHFKLYHLSFYLLSWKVSLYIVDGKFLSDIWFADIYYHSAGCLFTVLMVSFVIQKFLNLIQSRLTNCFCHLCFSYQNIWNRYLRKHCLI